MEAVLSAHPGVSASAAFGVPSAVMGELVAAAVVPRRSDGGFGSTEGQMDPRVEMAGVGLDRVLIEWCRSRLAHFKVPVQVWDSAAP